jgi:subtilisin family serine protease
MNTRVLFLVAGVCALAACGGDRATNSTTHSTDLSYTGRSIVSSNSYFRPDFISRVAALGGTVESLHVGAGIAVVNGVSIAQLAGLPGVNDVEADAEISLDDPSASAEADAGDISVASVSNPAAAARFSWQWNMRNIRADAAWAAGHLGSSTVTAAILDTGIDYDSRDLNGLVDLSRSASFIPADDALTASLFPTRNTISDYHGHGTNVASQIASKAGVFAGVTSKTTLIGVKVLSAHGSGALSAILNGILFATDMGANVANMSLGGGFAKAGNGRFVGLINKVFNFATSRGMLIVVAAGNAAADLDHDGNFHADFCDQPGVICVAAEGIQTWNGTPDVPSFFTNFGRSAISVAGPGGNALLDAAGNIVTTPGWPWAPAGDIASWVWSFCSKTRLSFDTAGHPHTTACLPGNRLLGFVGTSQATPHVAGLAALLVAETGRTQPAQIRAAIEQSADDLGQPGTDPFFGKGRIDVANALGL